MLGPLRGLCKHGATPVGFYGGGVCFFCSTQIHTTTMATRSNTRSYNTRLSEGFALANGEIDTSGMTLPNEEGFIPSEEEADLLTQEAPTQREPEADLSSFEIDF